MAIQKQTDIPSSEVAIRDARSTDALNIAKLGAHVFAVTFGHSVEPHELQAFLDEAYTESAIAKDLDDDAKDVIVAVDSSDEILGFAYLTRGTQEPCLAHIKDLTELQRIYVHPSAHGRGVGRLLSSTIHNMAREQGFKNIWLGVWEENVKAIKAYGKWGYRHVGGHDFVIGSVVQTDKILLKEL